MIALFFVFSSLLLPVASFGFGTSIGLFYFDKESATRKSETIWTAFVWLALVSLAVVAAGFLLRARLALMLFGSATYGFAISLAIVNLALMNMLTPLMLYVQLERRVKTFVVLNCGGAIFTVLCNLVLVAYFKMGVAGFLLGTVIGQALLFTVFLVSTVRSLRFSFDPRLLGDLLGQGLPVVPGFAFLFVLQQGNVYLLRWLTDLHTVGLYGLGFNIGFVMNFVVGGFTNAWTPYFLSYQERQGEGAPLFGRILTYYVFGYGSLTLMFFIWARAVVIAMTHPPFYDSYRVIGLTAAAQFFIGISSVFLPPMYFAKKVRYVTVIQAAACAIAVTLNLLLIPSLKHFGAALSLGAGLLAMAVFQLAWCLRRRNTVLQIPYEWPRIAAFSALFVLVSAAYLFQRNWSLSVEALFGLSGSLVLGAVAYGLLSAPERAFVRQTISDWRSLFGKGLFHAAS